MQNSFVTILKEVSDEEYFEYYIAYLISPIITGIKPASIININNNSRNFLSMWITNRDKFLSSLGLHYMIIRREYDKETVLIYNRENLSNIFKCSKIKTFLKNYGYHNLDDIEGTLCHLNTRFEFESCPHEIGIFLGIPLHDVEDFINCNDRPCLLCGYWKVYSEENYAKELFKQYDLSKEMVANCIIEKKGFTHIRNHLSLSISA